jgi:hypothetical protein
VCVSSFVFMRVSCVCVCVCVFLVVCVSSVCDLETSQRDNLGMSLAVSPHNSNIKPIITNQLLSDKIINL